jgi:RND family efflux transporter MFP subunit
MRGWLIFLLVAALMAGGGIGGWIWHSRARPTAQEKAGQKYQCPMHPYYTSDRPGDCPICGMRLVPIKEEKEKKREQKPHEAMPGMEMPGVEMPKAEAKVPDLTTIELSPEKQQLIGVTTDVVRVTSLEKVIRTVGIVKVDEARLKHVHTKVTGWVEKLFINFTGERVGKGQPMLSIYSPELVATQQEYLLAMRLEKRTRQSPYPEARLSSRQLVEDSRRRLLLWDITRGQIAEVERTGEPMKSLRLYAPFSGYVVDIGVREGTYATPDLRLYTIADLSRVWVEADIYEYELSLVRTGQRATLTLVSYPGRVFTGRVSFIYPYLQGQTRTLQARFEFPNPGLLLKPEMYGDVELKIPMGVHLTIPEEAVLESGTRNIAFVAKGRGTFEPREVELGPKAGGRYPVLKGLHRGERVVTSANFLIDAESKLKAALKGMGAGMSMGGEHKHGQ